MDDISGGLAVIVGFAISVLLEIIPGLKEEWKTWRWKPLTLLVGFIVAAVALQALTCGGFRVPIVAETCDWRGYLVAAAAGLWAFAGSQGGYITVSRKLPNALARQQN